MRKPSSQKSRPSATPLVLVTSPSVAGYTVTTHRATQNLAVSTSAHQKFKKGAKLSLSLSFHRRRRCPKTLGSVYTSGMYALDSCAAHVVSPPASSKTVSSASSSSPDMSDVENIVEDVTGTQNGVILTADSINGRSPHPQTYRREEV